MPISNEMYMDQPISTEHVTLPKEVEFAKRLVRIMDDAFTVPIVNYKIGLDPLIGLIPGLGDLFSFLISVLILVSMVRHGIPRNLIFKMVLNIVTDLIVGSIPVIGDLWDFFFRANRRNLQILIDHHSKEDRYAQTC
jgi:hypothetical protein